MPNWMIANSKSANSGRTRANSTRAWPCSERVSKRLRFTASVDRLGGRGGAGEMAPPRLLRRGGALRLRQDVRDLVDRVPDPAREGRDRRDRRDHREDDCVLGHRLSTVLTQVRL